VPPSTTVPGSVRALDVLALIPVEKEHQQDYDRDRHGYPDDRDGDGCDTRSEVLIRDSTTRAQADPVGCTIGAGDWYSAYDDRTSTDPAELEIDHGRERHRLREASSRSAPRRIRLGARESTRERGPRLPTCRRTGGRS
jgi:hypothetical protein